MIEALIAQFISCMFVTWAFNPQPCVDILNEIAYINEQEEINPKHYIIWIEWFPYDSDANEVANYWYTQSNWDIDMITTFMCEAMFNKNAIWRAGEKWICQLQPNKTNNKWINDERWNDIMYQAEVCLDKRQAVPKPSRIWSCWSKRDKQKAKIYYFNAE